MSAETPIDPPLAKADAPAWKSGPLVGCISALAAGLLVFLFLQTLHPVFWTDVGRDEVGFLPPAVQWRLDRFNSMLVLGLLGGLTGAALAIGEGASRGSWMSTLKSAAVCAAVSVLFGGLGGYLGHRLFEHLKSEPDLDELTKAMCVSGLMLGATGGGIGLAAGLFLGRSRAAAIRAFLGGLLAGLLASIIYPLIVAALLPNAMTSVLLPLEVSERLLWLGLGTGLCGAIIPAVARPRPAPHKSGSSST